MQCYSRPCYPERQKWGGVTWCACLRHTIAIFKVLDFDAQGILDRTNLVRKLTKERQITAIIYNFQDVRNLSNGSISQLFTDRFPRFGLSGFFWGIIAIRPRAPRHNLTRVLDSLEQWFPDTIHVETAKNMREAHAILKRELGIILKQNSQRITQED